MPTKFHEDSFDKPCHLHLKRCHAWPSLCFQSHFYSIIHCTLAVLPEKNPEKNCMSLERDNPTHCRSILKKKMPLSNPKWSDGLNFSAFWFILFKLFNNILISDEQSPEWYGLLLTPQCDKLCHLHIGRGHTWMILFSAFFPVNN